MSARLEIDLDAFAANLRVVRDRVAPAEHMLVVKDDAYAHGLAPIVRRAWSEGVRWFGAFDVPTGSEVRAVAPDARIFSWLVGSRADARAGIAAGLDLGVGDPDLLEDVATEARASGAAARVHLKIDTGLHRNGIRPEQWDAVTARAAALESDGLIVVEGVWSHLAEASDAEDDAARALFDDAVGRARAAGLRPSVLHLSASAASFARPEFRYDLARVGAFAYGIRPAGGPAEAELGIRPIANLTAPVVEVAGDEATIALGSLDGFPSTLAGKAVAHTPGGSRRILRVALDSIAVGAWPAAAVGDTVTVFGGEAPSVTDHAELIDTIGEELALRVSPLVPRVYAGE